MAALVLYFNVFAGDSGPARTAGESAARTTVASPAPTAAVPAFPGITEPATTKTERRRESKNGVVAEFKIRQGAPPGQEKPDPATIDPTLRLDLLAKLQTVEPPAVMRNIFQYGPAPPAAPVKPVELPKNTPKIPINQPAPPTGPPPPPGCRLHPARRP